MNQPQSLREVVDPAKVKYQTSAWQLGVKVPGQGFNMHGNKLGHIRNGTYESASTDEIVRARAWLTDVSDETAFMAARLPVPGQPLAEALLAGVDYVPANARKAAIDRLRVLVDMIGAAADKSSHMNQAGEAPARTKAKMASHVDPYAPPDADELGHIPLPANYYELAADSSRNYCAEEEARTSARGEETQDMEPDSEGDR